MAPVLTGWNVNGLMCLVVGGGSIATARVIKGLENGAHMVLICPKEDLSNELERLVRDAKVTWHDREFIGEDLTTLGRDEVDHVVDAVFVTLSPFAALATAISKRCKRLRIPINVADAPSLCTFTLLASFADGPLQVGITTAGNGCKLASRIRREIKASLPTGLGNAVEKIGTLRAAIQKEDGLDEQAMSGGNDDDREQDAGLNRLVANKDYEMNKTRRMQWLSQICEYWPLSKLTSLDKDDFARILEAYASGAARPLMELAPAPRGQISLVGSGPGDPGLLTVAALDAIQSAQLVLADKLIAEAVLALVPRSTELYIARKFPGNAERAQEELLDMGTRGLERGLRVVRLKQGDPYIFGRGGEEVEFFTKCGYKPTVIAGITSALAAPLWAGIPATHRAVADQVLVCTGTGRKGMPPEAPEYVSTRTTIFLMALHRIQGLVQELREKQWPLDLPCAVVERASCKDQRVVRSTLMHVVEAIEAVGSRPPGLLVTGPSCHVLNPPSDSHWTVEEGTANASS